MRLIDAEGSELQTQLKFIREAEYQIYGGGSWGFTVKCERAIENAPTIQPEPHWIPVTERLPEKFDYYLVSGINSVWFARYESGRFLGILSGHALDTVIAWTPLPEPYKEVTE